MAGCSKKRLLVVAGPTASGKSGASVEAALKLGGEIISADSMQIYRGLDIATAKPDSDMQRLVPHHLIDILDPQQQYSSADFVRDAAAAAEEILARGRLPIVCGGTGFYIDSLVRGADFPSGGRSQQVRERLELQATAEGVRALWERLIKIDPLYSSSIHENDVKRIVRALELYETTGLPPSAHRKTGGEGEYQCVYILLTSESRQLLYKRIDDRVDSMVQAGLMAEAEYVYRNRFNFTTAVQAIGYKELFPYFEGTQSAENCIAQLKKATRRYAKRQITWFKRSPVDAELPVDGLSHEEIAQRIVSIAEEKQLI